METHSPEGQELIEQIGDHQPFPAGRNRQDRVEHEDIQEPLVPRPGDPFQGSERLISPDHTPNQVVVPDENDHQFFDPFPEIVVLENVRSFQDERSLLRVGRAGSRFQEGLGILFYLPDILEEQGKSEGPVDDRLPVNPFHHVFEDVHLGVGRTDPPLRQGTEFLFGQLIVNIAVLEGIPVPNHEGLELLQAAKNVGADRIRFAPGLSFHQVPEGLELRQNEPEHLRTVLGQDDQGVVGFLGNQDLAQEDFLEPLLDFADLPFLGFEAARTVEDPAFPETPLLLEVPMETRNLRKTPFHLLKNLQWDRLQLPGFELGEQIQDLPYILFQVHKGNIHKPGPGIFPQPDTAVENEGGFSLREHSSHLLEKLPLQVFKRDTKHRLPYLGDAGLLPFGRNPPRAWDCN